MPVRGRLERGAWRVICSTAAVVAAIGATVPSAAQISAEALVPPPDTGSLTATGAIQAAAYPEILVGARNTKLGLNITLSIQNPSLDEPLVIRSVDYLDMAGKPLEHYLDQAFALRPLATARIVVPVENAHGGAGASFLVRWAAPRGSEPPAVETVMVGSSGTHSYVFVSRGHAARPATEAEYSGGPR